MSYSEDYDWRCMNCEGFHEYGNCPYYDQRWKNQPKTFWEGYSWNPPHHQFYGEYEHQPLEQDEPHQRQGSSGKKSIEELLESFLVQQEITNKRQDAAMRNLETQILKLSRQLMEECEISTLSEEAISLEENGEELQIEEERDCELIEESLTPQALKEDEEEESPEKGPEVVLELECDNMVGEQKEQVVECEERKEVPIVDFVFGDKLIIGEEKPPSISTYLMNLWSTGIQGKKQAGEWNNFGSTWNRISEKFLNPLILYLIKLALMSDRCCNTMMELGQNLHDLKGLKNFAIDTG
jgi:hypothetical protein